MLKYLRNKYVCVDKLSGGSLKVRGMLDDDLYGLEMEVVFGRNDLAIQSIQGKWNRYTTPECPRALFKLDDALGMKVESGFRASIQKVIGRGACRHYANLLVEMGHAAKMARIMDDYHQQKGRTPVLSFQEFYKQYEKRGDDTPDRPDVAVKSEGKSIHPQADVSIEKITQAQSLSGKFQKQPGHSVLDLHVHTSPASACSSIKVEDLVQEACQIGLDGIVLTDHNYIWDETKLEDLRQKFGFLILAGNEVITDQGDVLTFGLKEPIAGVIRLQDLKHKVDNAGGYMVLAHPFRGFLMFGSHQLGLTVENAADRSLFAWVDAMEVLNAKVTDQENDFSNQVAQKIELPGIGGSDAHEPGTVGKYATEFLVQIQNEADLIDALHQGRFRPVRFR